MNRTNIFLCALFSVLVCFGSASKASAGQLALPTVSVSKERVVSGETITVTFALPANVTNGRLFLFCSDGVKAVNQNADWCNRYRVYDAVPKTDTFTLINTTSQDYDVLPNLNVYTTDSLTAPIGNTGPRIVVEGVHDTGTSTDAATLTFSESPRTPKRTVRAEGMESLLEIKVKASGTEPTITDMLSVMDQQGNLGKALAGLTLYYQKKKISASVSTHPDIHETEFYFRRPLTIKPGRAKTFTIKGVVSKTLIGQTVQLYFNGSRILNDGTVTGTGILGNPLTVVR
jgi:hypothetical protein